MRALKESLTMKNTVALCALALLAAGCGNDTTPSQDLAAPSDLSASAQDGGDMAMKACTSIGTWPGVDPSGFFDPDYFMAGPATVAVSHEASGTPWNELSVEAWHGVLYPSTVTFHDGDTYNDCDTCVIYGEGCDDTGCNTYYFAQAGTTTITQADDVEAMGSMKASATKLKLVEWDFDNDVPVTNANCVEVSSASWDVSWTATDGGTHD
jgi:hypothetical protein